MPVLESTAANDPMCLHYPNTIAKVVRTLYSIHSGLKILLNTIKIFLFQRQKEFTITYFKRQSSAVPLWTTFIHFPLDHLASPMSCFVVGTCSPCIKVVLNSAIITASPLAKTSYSTQCLFLFCFLLCS